jgi:2-amino-4-hydroxy-6-hydroxymethyldihydropteridine diphosphokinase
MHPAYHTAFVALGSNLDDRLRCIEAATAQLAQLSCAPIQRSHLYDTTPMYLEEQPRFVNTVVRLQTDLDPDRLLARLLDIETSLGRVRAERNGPRVIDLDLLLWDNLVRETEALILPHPRLHERPFVLRPLLDLDPGLRHPTLDRRVDELWAELLPNLAPDELPIRLEP